jgi:hypothetical protein
MIGTLPLELGNLDKLQNLDVSESPFDGTLPLGLAALADLEKISVDEYLVDDLDVPFCDLVIPISTVEANCLEDEVTCSCCTKGCNAFGQDCEDI